jgi:hypothetical protein
MLTPRRARRGRLLALALLPLVALAACGGGEPSAADSSEVGKAALKDSGLGVSSAVERCVGRSMIEDLGVADARTAVNKTDLSKLPKAQRKAAIAAFDHCVPAAAFAKTLVSQLSAGQSGGKLESCLAKAFDGKVGTAAAALSNPTSDPATTKLLDTCPTADLTQAMLKSMLSSSVSEEVATCALGKLGDVKLSDILTQSKAASVEVQAAVTSCQAGQ